MVKVRFMYFEFHMYNHQIDTSFFILNVSMGLTDVLFGPIENRRKREKELENVTWATTALRSVCCYLEPRAEIRACIILPGAFMVNWESSFFLDQTAQTAGMESKPNKKTGSLVQRSSCNAEAHESSS